MKPNRIGADDAHDNARLIAALQENWLAETEGAHTYRALVEQEKDPTRQEILLEMAEAEERHAAKWTRRLQELGATAGSQHYVVIAGLAGMLASALSMGSGAYLATKSENEMHEAQLARERREIEEDPEEEKHELELIYRLRGFSPDEARLLVDRVSQNQDLFLETLAQLELGISPEPSGNPVSAAISGSISTAVGAIIPVIPFFFLSGYTAIIVAAIVSLIAHFAVGAAKTLVTIRSWWSSGLEMTVVGAVEGVITYVVGVGFAHF
jgi:vacuolar iron transporter family protein